MERSIEISSSEFLNKGKAMPLEADIEAWQLERGSHLPTYWVKTLAKAA